MALRMVLGWCYLVFYFSCGGEVYFLVLVLFICCRCVSGGGGEFYVLGLRWFGFWFVWCKLFMALEYLLRYSFGLVSKVYVLFLCGDYFGVNGGAKDLSSSRLIPCKN